MSHPPPPARDVVLVAAGGAVGALGRVALATWFPSPDGSFPAVTFLENVLGAFALVALLAVVAELAVVGRRVRLAVGTGVLGSFTTYSALAVEVDRLLAGGGQVVAAVYAVGSLTAGLAAGVVGLLLGKRAASLLRDGARRRR